MSSSYREYDPATLKRLQGVLLGMLDDFTALCDRHGLRWWSDAGTTIGALRHGGMIPWDDDIDLCLVREDYDRFLELAEKELGDKYYVLDADRFPAYPLMTARLCLRGTKFREECMKGVDAPFGIFLDLYCFDHLADDPKAARRQWGRAWFWGKLMVLRTVRSPVLYFRGFRASLTRLACFFAHYAVVLSTTRAFLHRRAKRWARLHAGEKTESVFYPFSPVPFRNDIRLADLFPARDMPFDGRTMRIPNKALEFLSKEFGDVMVPPPPEKRHNHPPLELDFGGGGDGAPAGVPHSARQAALKELAFRAADALERAGVRFSGIFGTALGALRHGDMIPWDDDIDFAVLPEDLPAALAALRADPGLCVWDWEDDPAGETPLRKIFWRAAPGDPRLRREVHVDLFVLEPAPAEGWRRRVRAWALQGLRVAVWSKLPGGTSRRAARAGLAPLRWAAALLAAPLPAAWLKRAFARLAAPKRGIPGAVWTPMASSTAALMKTYRREDFERPARLPFGGRALPVPGDTEGYLETEFGDWRKLPPPSQRRGHTWDETGNCLSAIPADRREEAR